MKTFITAQLIIILSFAAHAQNFETLSFGTDTTLDVLTWNIEHFPKNGTTTFGYVQDVLSRLHPDIVAIQEVEDVTEFANLAGELDGFVGELSTSYFAGLAYLYDTTEIDFIDYYEIYTASQYWNTFPRAPKILEFNYKGNHFKIINNHLKCCGDGVLDTTTTEDEEHRRYMAAILLKTYIDQQSPDTHVILTGDLNDEITDASTNNVFRHFIANPGSYQFADMGIATGASSGWSYPSWPSHLDHFLITDGLYDDMENPASSCEVIRIDSYFSSWSAYDNAITDHRPVGLRIQVNENLAIPEAQEQTAGIHIYPVPAQELVTLQMEHGSWSTIEMLNSSGKTLRFISLKESKPEIQLSVSDLAPGVYFLKISDTAGKIYRSSFVKSN